MPCLKRLTEEQIVLVHDWLRSKDMPVHRLMHREYSDAVLVAKLLKNIYPRCVDVHNYQPRYSIGLKMDNWQTLNYKVLNRIGLRLSSEQSESLAKGEVGYVERLLWLIMNLTNAPPCVKSSKHSGIMKKSSSTRSPAPPKQKLSTRFAPWI